MGSLPILEESGPDEHALARIARDLSNHLRGEVRFNAHDRMLYATDASIYQVEPLGVVIPASVDDAARAVQFCAQRGLAILPRGAGTSLAGQCVSRAVVIDFSPNCRAVRSVDAAARRCQVEPGVTIDELNEHLAPTGLFFAPDPATSRHANIGGCVGNNAAGARSIRYGRTSENIAALDVCLSDGQRVRFDRGAALRDQCVRDLTERVARVVREHAALIRTRFPTTLRRNAGYNLDLILRQMEPSSWLDSRSQAVPASVLGAINLAPLMCGSEGTLAVTLGAELLLEPVPKARGLAVLGFTSVDAAIDAVSPILETDPSAVELLDDMVIDMARANVQYRRYVKVLPAPGGRTPAAVLYVEYLSDDSGDEITERFARLSSIVPGVAIRTHTDPGAMLDAWNLRKAGEPLLHGIPGRRSPVTFVEDNAVPTERLGEFVRRFREIVASHGTRAAFWAHASVGVLHVRPLLDLRDEDDRARMHSIAVEIADLARSLGGVMSGEHGDGRVRTPLLERFYGSELMSAFQQIKSIFDPAGLLNPGNIVRPRPIESITASTRIRPRETDVAMPAVETYFEFDNHRGFLGAAELCNGAGVCRKKRGSTMCPSYMATLDERHSTRGRANALRLAISGQLPGPSPWLDPETIATLDLCLSCKACKSECPTNVDVAKLKAEYTAQRFRAAGKIPLQARLFAHVRTINRIGSMTPVLANSLIASRIGRALAARVLGIDPRRAMPSMARSLPRVLKRSIARPIPPDAPVVVLFGDCFTMYNEPDVGLAAIRALTSLGYRVELANAGCCGRAAISNGVLGDAIRMIDRTASRLIESSPDDRPILFLEPSCHSAICDDWLSLKLKMSIDQRQLLAERAMLVEDFIEQRWGAHPMRPVLAEPTAEIVFHGHCHQKALLGPDSGVAMLRRVAGSRLRVLDAGCCGMAGAFGYTADHYDLSMKIAELSLLPAVRAAGDEAIIVAGGTSCRHQIRDGTGVRALHPIELLDRLIARESS
ncbi:MAG: FAD-binding protein [Planctomycetes bacterium]|nr:FAD-binding protein [Planctomycetota bacterium]